MRYIAEYPTSYSLARSATLIVRAFDRMSRMSACPNFLLVAFPFIRMTAGC